MVACHAQVRTQLAVGDLACQPTTGHFSRSDQSSPLSAQKGQKHKAADQVIARHILQAYGAQTNEGHRRDH